MRALKIIRLLGLASLLIASSSLAGPVSFDASLSKEKRLEAGAPCADGSCYNLDRDSGLSGLEAQVHKINIFDKNGKDPLVRISKESNGQEFAPIGRIRTSSEVLFKDGSSGHALSTGFLVGPCLIWTNYHAVFGESKSPNKTDFPVQFTANRTVTAKPIAWGPANVRYSVANDWAILKLEGKECLGNEVGWLSMLEEPIQTLKDKSLLTAGYPIRKLDPKNPNILWGQQKCNLRESATNDIFVNTLFNDCALSSGQSGSPILVRNNSGKLRFIGMQAIDNKGQDAIMRSYDMGHANVGLDLFMGFTDERLALIEGDIKSNKSNGRMASR
jgi:V8-like Glu-specific endopeptidase